MTSISLVFCLCAWNVWENNIRLFARDKHCLQFFSFFCSSWKKQAKVALSKPVKFHLFKQLKWVNVKEQVLQPLVCNALWCVTPQKCLFLCPLDWWIVDTPSNLFVTDWRIKAKCHMCTCYFNSHDNSSYVGWHKCRRISVLGKKHNFNQNTISVNPE